MYAEPKGVPVVELAVALSAVPLLAGRASLCSESNRDGKLGGARISGRRFPRNARFLAQQRSQRTQHEHDYVREDPGFGGRSSALTGIDEPWEASIPVANRLW
jgi:hypothetical protein